MEQQTSPSFFSLTLQLRIRPCTREDLRNLEWFGMFTPQRSLIEEAFRRQEPGEVLMLVACVQGFPVGQVWVDLTLKRAASVGVLWALRVLPPLRRRGIGRRLIGAAEEALQERGFAYSELGVEKNNPAARRLYEALGYQVAGEERAPYSYTTPAEETIQAVADQWLLQKTL